MPAAHTAAIHIMNALALVLHGVRRLGPKAQGKPLRSTVTILYIEGHARQFACTSQQGEVAALCRAPLGAPP